MISVALDNDLQFKKISFPIFFCSTIYITVHQNWTVSMGYISYAFFSLNAILRLNSQEKKNYIAFALMLSTVEFVVWYGFKC